MKLTQPFDIFNGTGLKQYGDEEWMLSPEIPAGMPHQGSSRLDFANVHIQWQSYDDIPDWIRGKLAVLFVMGDEHTGEHGEYMWDKAGGYTLQLTKAEIESLVEENDDGNY